MPEVKRIKFTFEQKWGDDPFTALGHTQVPSALILYSSRLKLTPEECWLIACILLYKHTPDHPYPSQELLAELYNQDVRTIRRIVKRIVDKKLMLVERVRGDLGRYDHLVYDFTPLRTMLNACYYSDHPQERPTGQKCPVVPPPDKKRGHHRTKSVKPPDNSCQTTGLRSPVNQSLKESKEGKEDSSLALFLEADVPRACAVALKLDAMTSPPSRFDADWMRKKLTADRVGALIDADPRVLSAVRRNWEKIPRHIQVDIEPLVRKID